MSRCLHIFILVLFIIWILPLGIFISPSKEKLACDGQRAICLCSHSIVKHHSQETGKTIFKTVSETQKEKNNSSGHDFLSALSAHIKQMAAATYTGTDVSTYHLLMAKRIDHIPKLSS